MASRLPFETWELVCFHRADNLTIVWVLFCSQGMLWHLFSLSMKKLE